MDPTTQGFGASDGGKRPPIRRRAPAPKKPSLRRFIAPIVAVVVVFSLLLFAVWAILADKEPSVSPAVTTAQEPPQTLPPETDPSETAEETSPPETEPLLEQSTVSFVAAGDNLVYRPNIWEAEERARAAGKEEMDFFFTYEKIRDTVAGADLAFINQETLLCGRNYEWSGYPLFNGPFEMGKTLAAIGFDVVNIATNHMLDQGYATGEGIRITREFWDTQPVTLIGGYLNEADFNDVRIVEKNGIRIAFLAYTEHTNGLRLSSGEVVVPYFDKDVIRRQVAAAKERADLVFVSAHWGNENTSVLTDFQEEYAQYLADLGVDVILGTHSHCWQPIRWIAGENGHKTLCAFSLGNFIAEMHLPINALGGFLSFDIVPDRKGNYAIENVTVIPTVSHFNAGFRDNTVYYLKDYTDELAAASGSGISFGNPVRLSDLYAYLNSTIDASFLPDFVKNR
ncbi:MAG: CapA family protein [Clostridia bacterium]|nr:CapA family protein [Clostridia bacterium]